MDKPIGYVGFNRYNLGQKSDQYTTAVEFEPVVP